MPSIIKNRISTMGVSSFVDKYGVGSSGENLYMTIGKDSAWGNESIPDTPFDKLGSAANNGVDTEYTLFVGAHAMVQVPLANVQPVIPRVNWASGQEYNALRTDIVDPFDQTNFYVLNSASQVWKCIEGYRNSDGVVTANAAVSSADGEPYAASPTASQQVSLGADGYTWEYMYTVSGAASNALTTSWLPINYGGIVTGNDNPASIFELGCRHMMLVGEFDGSITISGTDDEFRQVGILDNPVIADGTTAATAATYQDPATEIFTGAGLTNNIGKLFYHENRTVVVRNASQIEQIKVVIEF